MTRANSSAGRASHKREASWVLAQMFPAEHVKSKPDNRQSTSRIVATQPVYDSAAKQHRPTPRRVCGKLATGPAAEPHLPTRPIPADCSDLRGGILQAGTAPVLNSPADYIDRQLSTEMDPLCSLGQRQGSGFDILADLLGGTDEGGLPTPIGASPLRPTAAIAPSTASPQAPASTAAGGALAPLTKAAAAASTVAAQRADSTAVDFLCDYDGYEVAITEMPNICSSSRTPFSAVCSLAFVAAEANCAPDAGPHAAAAAADALLDRNDTPGFSTVDQMLDSMSVDDMLQQQYQLELQHGCWQQRAGAASPAPAAADSLASATSCDTDIPYLFKQQQQQLRTGSALSSDTCTCACVMYAKMPGDTLAAEEVYLGAYHHTESFHSFGSESSNYMAGSVLGGSRSTSADGMSPDSAVPGNDSSQSGLLHGELPACAPAPLEGCLLQQQQQQQQDEEDEAKARLELAALKQKLVAKEKRRAERRQRKHMHRMLLQQQQQWQLHKVGITVANATADGCETGLAGSAARTSSGVNSKVSEPPPAWGIQSLMSYHSMHSVDTCNMPTASPSSIMLTQHIPGVVLDLGSDEPDTSRLRDSKAASVDRPGPAAAATTACDAACGTAVDAAAPVATFTELLLQEDEQEHRSAVGISQKRSWAEAFLTEGMGHSAQATSNDSISFIDGHSIDGSNLEAVQRQVAADTAARMLLLPCSAPTIAAATELYDQLQHRTGAFSHDYEIHPATVTAAPPGLDSGAHDAAAAAAAAGSEKLTSLTFGSQTSAKQQRTLTHPITGQPLLLGPAVAAKTSRMSYQSLGAPGPQLFGVQLQSNSPACQRRFRLH